MTRNLITIGVTLCLLGAFLPRTLAQDQNPDWIELSPAGESFRIEMPNQPRLDSDSVTIFGGNRYSALTGAATYTLWSIKNANYKSDQDADTSLDATADLLWEKLLLPDREKLEDKDRRLARMWYIRELPPEGLPGREYSLVVGLEIGTTRFFVAREHTYIMLVMQHPGRDCPSERFFTSFRATSIPSPSSPLKPAGDGGPAPSADNADENRIFSGREVTSKARVLEKPEPTYSESARKFGVTGTVVIRCVFSKNGEVTNLHVIRKLPHGLTQRAIAAAQAIRFTPAMKDGQPVSMWMELQYNFNLY
jgi:TonB family protein